MTSTRSGRWVRAAVLVGILGAAAVGTLVVTAREAEAGAPDAGAPDPKVPPDPKAKIPPDPPALAERTQWVFDLRWDHGEPYLVQIHKIDMGGPHPTPRVMGRFALELFEGPTLIERARFDFPMLGAPEATDAGWNTPARFEPKLRTRIGVVFPATKRGTRLELWDRATDRRWPLPWPPTEGQSKSTSPAADGKPDAGR